MYCGRETVLDRKTSVFLGDNSIIMIVIAFQILPYKSSNDRAPLGSNMQVFNASCRL